jgi:hypothetical protein
MERIPRVPVTIPLDQFTKRFHIPAQNAGDDYGIRATGFHRAET